MKKTCGSCRHFEHGLCKKNPPVLVPALSRVGDLMVQEVQSRFPDVHHSDWCSQWMTREGLAPWVEELGKDHGGDNPILKDLPWKGGPE